ncbi:MAG: lipoprotein [Frankiales bacterium]|nr:lipoprotein [Frankiales bacterium]
MQVTRATAVPAALLAAVLGVAGCTQRAAVSTPPPPAPSRSPSASLSSSPPVSPTVASPSAATPTTTTTGYDATDAARIVSDMTAAVADATSVRYDGTIDQRGTPIAVAMTVGRDAARGTVDFGGGRISLLRAAGVLFLMAPTAVWRAQGVTDAPRLKRIDGKWVRLGPADAARFRVFTDLPYLLSGFEQPGYAVMGPRAVDGVPAVELRDATGTVLTVAGEAPHVPLTVTSAQGKGSLTFTRWNAPFTVTAPPDAVDLSATPAA